MAWKLIKDFRPKGHAYFRGRTGQIAIADESGELPEDTDDGVLISEKTIRVRESSLELQGGYSTPLAVEEMKWLVNNGLAEIRT